MGIVFWGGRSDARRRSGGERASAQRSIGMLDRVREGESAVLVIRGEAGIGKTALMQYCARQASGCRVTQIAGVESELEMPFAALHQLCAPMLDELGALPEPQQQALRVAFGRRREALRIGSWWGSPCSACWPRSPPTRPLVCLIDDAQWLDEPSRQVLGFVGRRLLAEPVLLAACGQGGRRGAAVSRPDDPDARGARRGRRAGAAHGRRAWSPRRAGSRPDRGRDRAGTR